MLKRILCCVTLLTGISSFGQPQFFPTGGNNPSHVTVGGGTNGGSGTTYTAGAGISIAGTVISTNGSSTGGTNITVVGSTNITFFTNISVGSTYTNNYSVPITIGANAASFTYVNTGANYASLTVTYNTSGQFVLTSTVTNALTSQVLAIPAFSVNSGATWGYSNSSVGAGNSVSFSLSQAQVSYSSPVNPTVGFITSCFYC